MQALVIAAYPGCGKTYYTRGNFLLSCMDSDSSLYSWIYDENGKKTDRRNPIFPVNYIDRIKNNLNIVDVIFVSTHKEVLEALDKEQIPHLLMYPSIMLKDKWKQVLSKRTTGLNDNNFINSQMDHWEKFHNDLKLFTPNAFRKVAIASSTGLELCSNCVNSIPITRNPFISTRLIELVSEQFYNEGIDLFPYFKLNYPNGLYKNKMD